MSLKITDNVSKIEEEVQDGDFNLNLKDHILHLPSFINPDLCKDVVKNLKTTGLDKSTPYTDGLLNDYTDSYFDTDIFSKSSSPVGLIGMFSSRTPSFSSCSSIKCTDIL